MHFKLTLILVFWSSVLSSHAASTFTEVTNSFPTLWSASVFAVDIDSDGDLDLLNGGRSSLTAPITNRLFLNASGRFTASGGLPIPSPVRRHAVENALDLNTDGHLDFFITQEGPRLGEHYTSWTYFGNGDGTFRIATNSLPYYATPADADNDGDTDFYLPVEGIGGGLFYLNDGDDYYRQLLDGKIDYRGIWADFDSDDDNDLLIHSFGPARIRRNDQKIPFSDDFVFPDTVQSAAWGDCDNDQDLDLLIVHSQSLKHELRLYRNDRGDFSRFNLHTNSASLYNAQWIDFDRDGKTDILAFLSSRLLRFMNKGDYNFERVETLFPYQAYDFIIADFTGDHMPDLLLLCAVADGTARLRLYQNNSVSTNPLPPVPILLTALATNNHSVSLKWQLPPPPVTLPADWTRYSFNLRVGKTPGGSEIMSALSHPISGARYLPLRGNAGQSGTWLIRDLPPGTYYWTVQSVDHSLNASPFSEEATFTIAPYERTPQILAVSIRINGLPQLTLDGPTRSRAKIETSLDLLNWTPATGYTYIGGDPATYLSTNNDTRFYRFQIHE